MIQPVLHVCITGIFHRMVFRNLQHAYKSPGGTLVKTQILIPLDEMGPEILYFWQTPGWGWSCWSRDHTTKKESLRRLRSSLSETI